MCEELLYKKVRCSDLGVICTIFPNFKLERFAKGFIYSPSIYCGPTMDIPLFVERCDEPYVIVTPNGDIDLDDRDYLVEIALRKHSIFKKVDAHLYQALPWSEFIYFWKHLWVTGEVLFPEEKSMQFFNKILSNLEYPNIIIMHCFKNLDIININYILKRLLLFITNAREVFNENTKMGLLQNYFNDHYRNNVSFACKKLLYSTTNDIQLQFITFIIDLFIGGKKSWMKSN